MLGPHVFLILFNNLETSATAFKFVDDVTPTETLASSDIEMQLVADQVADWSDANLLNINVKKTKEMLIGPIAKLPPPPIALFDPMHRTCHITLQAAGCFSYQCLNWDQHVDDICSKANKRLHFLKLLKRSAMSLTDLLQYYKSVIRPVVEYACPAWQSSLNEDQRNRLEAIQKRALRIISGYNTDSSYETQCMLYGINSINFRLDLLTRSFFFNKVCQPNDCLHRLLPPERSSEAVSKLRRPEKLPGEYLQNRTIPSFFYSSLP
jgi:hypothetical protein